MKKKAGKCGNIFRHYRLNQFLKSLNQRILCLTCNLYKFMKTKPNQGIFTFKNVKKFLLIMKISLMLMVFSCLNIYASSIIFSQEMITVEIQNVSVRELIEEIEKKGGISFFYNDKLLELDKKVSAFYLEQPVEFVIDNILSQAGLTYKEIRDDFFVILPDDIDTYAPAKNLHLSSNNSNNGSKGSMNLVALSNSSVTSIVPIKILGSEKHIQQDFTVTGTVTSSEDGEPIPGVSVTVRGTTLGTVTDIDGEYSIEVPSEESVLRFSFIGMINRDIIVGQQRNINVELDPDVVGLDEIVVTGYGVQRRRDLTGSVSSVRAEEIEGMPVSSVERALQGRAAGVQITGADGGIPGGAVSVIIRGQGSFSSNQPLWIVDGVEVQSGGIGERSASSNALASMNFDDIESIDILKDASSTAIYGARGAAGVIIIETKRGRESEKPAFNFEVLGGFTSEIKRREVFDGPTWAKWDTERFINRYGIDSPEFLNRLQSGVGMGWYELGADGLPDFGTTPHYDWMDAVHRQGNMYSARLNVRGGTENIRYYSSISHSDAEGFLYPYSFARSNFRLNLDVDATERLRFDMQLSANISDQETSRVGGAWSSPIFGAVGIVPLNPIYDDEGNYFNAPQNLFGGNRRHLIQSLDLDHTLENIVKIVGNFSMSYDLTENMMYRATFGVDYNHSYEEQWYDPRAGDAYDVGGRLREYEKNINAIQTTQTISYNNIFGGLHEIGGVAGFETYERTYRNTSMRGENFPNHYTNVMNAAGEIPWWRGNITIRTRMGAFGRLNYTYDGKYLLTITSRYDASSRFGSENRWGFFPAAAIGWRISDEPFMAGLEELDNMMIRLSYGVSGTDAAGTYAALGLWAGGTEYLGTVGLYPDQLPNRYLTWEESKTLNLAISTTAFNGRLNLDIDLFSRWSEKLLLDRPLPRSTGWSSVTENVGRTMNEGIEISVNTVNIERDNFRWMTGFNISFVESEILELLPGADFFSNRIHVGQPMTARYMPVWAGVNPADGRPMYYDRNQNIVYNPVYEDRQWIGNEEPRRYGGLTNEVQFGNFGASIFFQYTGGNYKYQSDMRRYFCFPGDRNQYTRTWEDRWTEPGQITDVPQAIVGNAYAGNVQGPDVYASHMFQRADYIRLKDLSISYNVPGEITQRFGLTGMRIFARGTNLYTWTDYYGADPEVTGSDYGVYPQEKSITFGINTSF